MAKAFKPRLLSDRELNTIRGKAMAGAATTDEILSVFGHIDQMEFILDNEVDPQDGLGTEGWRRFFNHPDSD